MGITISDGRHWFNYIVKKTFNRFNIMIYIHELSEVLICLSLIRQIIKFMNAMWDNETKHSTTLTITYPNNIVNVY